MQARSQVLGTIALAVSEANAPHGSSGRPQACSASRASLDTAQCSLVSANAKPSVCLLAQARATRVLRAPPLLRPSSPRRRTSFAARQCHSTLLQSARKDWLGSTRLKELPSFVRALGRTSSVSNSMPVTACVGERIAVVVWGAGPSTKHPHLCLLFPF